MEITYKNYILKKDGSRFDLHKKVEAKDKETGESKTIERTIGYSYRLDSAINEIAHDLTEENSSEKQELAEYVKAYVSVVDKFRKEIRID